ncbi:MAG: bifunctional phosphopantothenoylcysteine decarboxylase/phosphopantothenate--cysteine ligase CoaBC [Coriobacteriia bacterium]|nr:bifunctional phosphopantothenoylcysteine decarboxylase/phosphopantothenate--cysteine ligase CoaBC [Coriobacteriia bacterium]
MSTVAGEKQQQTVLVGVTGGIGAYKACELVRTLMRRGYRVKVVMTEAATRFVTPLTFRTLTREPVATSLWADEPGDPVHHVSLAQEADVVVVAPCTANVLAKLAHGRADDLLTTTVLATEAPVVLAPAMNVHMWRKPITQANVAALQSRGFVVVAPGSGELACGDVGEGRLADVDAIARAVDAEARRARELTGVRVLVTAGPTYEPIDAVRFIGNRSSGKTGYAIAEEAARRGAEVTLVSGPTSLADPFGVRVVRVTTAAEMREAALAAWPETDVVIASAAVADVRPARSVDGKLKKHDLPDAIVLERNPDILAELGAMNDGSRVVFGFAAETGDPVAEARRKLAEKHCDLVVANDVSSELGFGTDENRVILVTADSAEELPVMEKRAIARELLDRVAVLVRERRGT